MNKYISLIEFTQEGIQNITDSPDRLSKNQEIAESLGCEIVDFSLTLGQYDAVAIVEAPDAETVTQLGVRVAQEGAVRTETLRAFSGEEYLDIIGGIPE